MNLKERWLRFWYEEYEINITVPKEVTLLPNGGKTETYTEKKYRAKKVIKADSKHFIFVDMKGHRNEIKYTNPVVFHIIKIY